MGGKGGEIIRRFFFSQLRFTIFFCTIYCATSLREKAQLKNKNEIDLHNNVQLQQSPLRKHRGC